MDYKKNIKDYYRSSQWLYQFFCYNKRTLGMHLGFWNQTTKTRQQAIINENQTIINIGKIKANHKVLDAGCGVGGSAIYIAQKTKAQVIGISLAPSQIKLAKKYAKNHQAQALTDFQVQDYTQTDFPDNSFDLIYGIESICYASPKSSFLREAYRLLKPKGKLIIADGYLKRQPRTDQEKRSIKDFKQAFVLKEFITPEAMEQQLKLAGFKNIRKISKIKAVKPSIDYFYRLAKTVKPLIQFLELIPLSFLFPLKQNFTALIKMREGIYGGFMAYYLHVAEK